MSSPQRRGRRSSGAPKKRSQQPAPKPLQPIEDPPEIESFHEWPDLGEEVLQAITDMNISVPTPIQALSIGPVLQGKDMIAKAETGTGKTLAFGAPMVAKVDPARRTVLGLVLSPTRELAEQVFQVLAALGEKRGLKCNLIVGGEPMQPQVKALQGGSQIVVGTPGRVLDLMDQGFLSFPWTEFVVLDEADKMLEIGFIDDVKKILQASNEYRQTLLFSATFPPALLNLAREYTRDPLEVATASGVSTAETVSQYMLEVDGDDRAHDLRRLIRASAKSDVFLVFCDRRTEVDKLMRRLERERFSVKALHGGYDQASRFRVMDAFRTGNVKVLVATDVASRGLDVNHVTHVVNLNAPRDVSDYTHRIGRTGRAGREGTAVTFVGGLDRRKWKELERALPKRVPRLRSVYDLYEEEEDRPRRRSREERSDRDRPRGDRPRRDEGRGPRRERDGERRPRRDEEDEGPKRRKRTGSTEKEGRPSRDDRPRRSRSDDSRGSEKRGQRRSADPAEREAKAGRGDADRPRKRPSKEQKPEESKRDRSLHSDAAGPKKGGPKKTQGDRKSGDRPSKSDSRPARSKSAAPKQPPSGGFGAGL